MKGERRPRVVPSENALLRSVSKELRSRGAYFVKQDGSGVPDVLCCYGGRFFAFELKTLTGRASPLQVRSLARVKEAGGVAAIVRTLGEVRTLLERTKDNVGTGQGSSDNG